MRILTRPWSKKGLNSWKKSFKRSWRKSWQNKKIKVQIASLSWNLIKMMSFNARDSGRAFKPKTRVKRLRTSGAATRATATLLILRILALHLWAFMTASQERTQLVKRKTPILKELNCKACKAYNSSVNANSWTTPTSTKQIPSAAAPTTSLSFASAAKRLPSTA